MTKTILLVDDDRDLLRGLGRLLRRELAETGNEHGLLVVTEESSIAALSWLERYPTTDCIICDGDMPGMNGRELFSRLPADIRARFVFHTDSSELFHDVPNRVIDKGEFQQLFVAVREVLLAERKDAA